jgi:hypothetical protein
MHTHVFFTSFRVSRAYYRGLALIENEIPAPTMDPVTGNIFHFYPKLNYVNIK